ncbi:chemotaxis protein [Herminiimonas fonticola]|uniref:Two-component system chemotaxis response regulator CheV n=1 Tax=Herminiimonas fonticola TaxID=303380 RepID=A0A4R6GFD3_9BURK|nr:chemotaxis protein [Herminiimonas fonticola]RBA24416.1 CheW-like domain [Herminiimonas fonticola]TDN93533.1 two-component system chemotaxis response regulator CheV [Herminiimonas fonticola]
MDTTQKEIDERSGLTSNNKFELMLFRLGISPHSETSEVYGINVFKLRELMAMPTVNSIANSPPHIMGMANIRGQLIPVINLPAALGCTPATGLNILMVTEFARTTQAFAVEEVDEIVRLNWSQVRAAEGAAAGGGTITSIAQLDADLNNTRLAQVLDVEQILRNVMPSNIADIDTDKIDNSVTLPPGAVILAADDSASARMLISGCLDAMGLPFVMAKTGLEAWKMLDAFSDAASKEGKSAVDKVALVLTDLEMPEMDGFTLTKKIKGDTRFNKIPVVIHSSLSGATNEVHVKSVGADAYTAKFKAEELAATLLDVLAKARK